MSKWGSWEALGARLAREQTAFVSLAVAYLITGKGGLALSYGHPAVSLVYPPAGLALGAFLVYGYRIWPIVFGAAAVMYASTIGPALPALVLAVARWGFGLSGLPLAVVVMMAALPVGSNALIFSQRYAALEAEATAAIVFSTLGFVVTASLWLAVLALIG